MKEDEFTARLEPLKPRLYRTALLYFGSESKAVDVVDEAVYRAWCKRKQLREPAAFESWLTRILIRECVNIQRRQRRAVPVDTLPEQAQEDGSDDVQSLREAIEALPQRQRTMVVLHYMEEYDVREVARIMGTTRGAVCAGLSRARGMLRRRLGEEFV